MWNGSRHFYLGHLIAQKPMFQLFSRICLALISLFCLSIANAQVVSTKQIYLWDVTLSMKQNGIWDQVKEQLSESISEIQDKTTEVIVIPFQDDVYEEKRVIVGDDDALSELLIWIQAYEVPMPQGGHGTNICRALERAEDFVINESIDCVFLLTDGAHEPKKKAMELQYPSTCLEEYLTNRWCAYATELDAYLVYYQLLGGLDLNIKRITDETCRVISVQPGNGRPDRLYYITPQVSDISKDRDFFSSGSFTIPVTTSLPKEYWKNCEVTGAIHAVGLNAPCEVTFRGTEIHIELAPFALQDVERFCSTPSEYCELSLKLELSTNESLMVVLTADEIPLHIKNGGERWFEIKVQ